MNEIEPSHLAEITKRLKTSSAVVPAILLTLICTPVGIAGSKISDPPLSFIFVLLAVAAPILAIIQICYFTIFDRDRLQNEEHIERKMLISRLNPQIGDSSSIIEIESSSSRTANPSAKDGGDA